jgi:hypothetical protein
LRITPDPSIVTDQGQKSWKAIKLKAQSSKVKGERSKSAAGAFYEIRVSGFHVHKDIHDLSRKINKSFRNTGQKKGGKG